MAIPIKDLIDRADALRRASRWHEARADYERALARSSNNPVIAHNLALCHLALGSAEAALAESSRALQIRPDLWQSALVRIMAHKALGQKDQALSQLAALHRQLPGNAEIALEYARMLLQHGGDAALAAKLAAPWAGKFAGDEALAVALLAQLYDRETEVSHETLVRSITHYAQHHLQMPEFHQNGLPDAAGKRPDGKPVRAARARTRARLRVGLLSPQFTASPVYYFTFGALRLLSEEVDLIFFNRGDRQDWATQAFQSVADDWIDSRSGTAEQLAQVLKSREVDVLLDLGGWMDPVGLRALSSKPVARQFKWVGGQSATTGLRAFDGFISDRGQTPVGSDALYTEPLINLKNGYVSYTAPPYMPEPGKRPRSSEIVLGVISNPAKISRGFLQDLARRLPAWSARVREERKRLKILFIEQRFRQASVRARIEAAFDPAINGGLASSVELEFQTPAGHQEFLASVAALDGIIDTWPYSGGLTTVEGLAMGVPTYWRGGVLFCERHTQAHLAYSGLDPREFQLARFDGVPQHGKRGRSLIGAGSGRLDHQALAKALHSRFSSRRSNR